MTALESVRRKRTTVMAAAALAVLVALAGLAYVGVKALRRYEGATKVSSTSIRIPATPVGMLATVNAENVLTSISIMVLPPNSAPGGSIVSVPVSIDSTLGVGPDRIPFTEVYATGGAEALSFAVEASLLVTLDVSQVANPVDTEALLAPVTQITAQLPMAVGDQFAAGQNTLTTAQAVQVINFTAAGVGDRARRGNVEAVWAGVAAAVGSGLATGQPVDATSTTVAGTPAVASVGELVSKLFAGPVAVRGISADPIDAADNPAAKDVEKLDRADGILVLASVAPRSMSNAAPGLVFRVEAPPGYEARVKIAIGVLLAYGSNVQSVYLNGPVQAKTVFLVGDQRVRKQAEENDGGFGDTQFEDAPAPIEGIDVIMQLGSDFLNDTTGTMPSTSTSTTLA